MKNKILVISAPSGSGKTVFANTLKSLYPELFEFSISHTTRPPREREIDGQHYHFVAVSEFKTQKEQGLFVDAEEVYPGTFYGTHRGELERIWSSSKIPILDIDTFGATKLKKNHPEYETLYIFISVTGGVDVLRERLIRRGECSASIAKRMEKAPSEIAEGLQNADYLISNDKGSRIEDNISRFIKILRRERFISEESAIM